jgi:hypothetical protein
MTNTAWRAAAAGFTIAVIAAGVLVAWNVWGVPFAPQTETQHQTYDRPITTLVFSDFASSDITVTAGEPGRVEIQRDLRWNGTKPGFTESWEGETLTVSHGCHGFVMDQCSIRYTVRVPASVALEAESSSGDVRVSKLTGALRVTTTSGDVTVAGATAQLTVATTSGHVRTDDLRAGPVEVSTTSGDIDLVFSTAPQTISVAATSGDTNVRLPNDHMAYRVAVQTTSGDRRVTVDQSQDAGRAISVHATSGDVTIGYR